MKTTKREEAVADLAVSYAKEAYYKLSLEIVQISAEPQRDMMHYGVPIMMITMVNDIINAIPDPIVKRRAIAAYKDVLDAIEAKLDDQG